MLLFECLIATLEKLLKNQKYRKVLFSFVQLTFDYPNSIQECVSFDLLQHFYSELALLLR